MVPFSHLYVNNRTIKPECASDDIRVISNTVAELAALLDKFFIEHESEITSRLELAWPKHAEINPSVVKTLRRLADQLTPLEVE